MSAEILILIALIVLNAFFAASEIALISLNDNKIRLMAESGNRKAKILFNLLSEPSRFLATIQIGITLAGFLASAFAAESYADKLAHFMKVIGVPFSEKWLESISVILITLILSYFTLVLGELVPKRIAMQKAETISMFAAVPLNLLSKASSPFVKLLTFSTNLIVRLFGVDPHADDDEVTEEEIRMMVDVGEEKGTIQEDQKFMINNIFELDNTLVSEIMTHRTGIVGIPMDYSLKEVAAVLNESKHTRVPVFENSIDNIVGILHVKDLIQLIVEEGYDCFKLQNIIRKPYMIPTFKRADELLEEMQKNKVHMAVVIDEYGGTAGIITIEDLLEEIVGNISDEHDDELNEIEKIDENTYMIKGVTSLSDVEDFLQVKLPTDDYETLNGFILGQLGRIPKPGEYQTVEFNGVIFKVEEVDFKKIAKVKVCRV